MRSIGGRIYIAGSIVSVVITLLALGWPEVVGASPGKGYGHAVLFGLWPIVSFVLYVRICDPDYRTGVATVLLTLLAVALPFYIAFG